MAPYENTTKTIVGASLGGRMSGRAQASSKYSLMDDRMQKEGFDCYAANVSFGKIAQSVYCLGISAAPSAAR